MIATSQKEECGLGLLRSMLTHSRLHLDHNPFSREGATPDTDHIGSLIPGTESTAPVTVESNREALDLKGASVFLDDRSVFAPI